MLDAAIHAILRSHQVSEQSALLAELTAQGFELTQPTLSRRLRALGYAKRDGYYRLSAQRGLRVLTATAVPPNLLVLKTEPGFANALAVQLDRDGLPGQVGTIAGDDTVFVAVLPEQILAALGAADALK